MIRELIRATPRWTKTRAIALKLIPPFYRDTDHIMPLANSTASVFCNRRSLMERSVIALGVWEQEESAFMDRTIKPGWTCLDIGANVGLHTCRMADLVGTNGRVVAFEPNPETRLRLDRNLTLNRFNGRVLIQPYAVSDSEGAGVLYVNAPGDENRNATLVADPENPQAQAKEIEVVRLDRYLDTAFHFIKVDIEGHEFAALRSGELLIRAYQPIILAEFAQYFAGLLGYTWRNVCQWFQSAGYTLWSLDGKMLSADLEFGPKANFNYVGRPVSSGYR